MTSLQKMKRGNNMNILVTGATGQLGNYVIDYLKSFNLDANTFGLVRKQEQADELMSRGVQARIGDYADKESLVKAFEGIDRLLFISVPQSDLQVNVVEAIKASHISYVAYTSINGIEHSKFGLELNHRQTEKLLAATNIPHTFLRNSWYLEMEQGNLEAAVATGYYYYLSDGKLSAATRKEYAEAAARVISSDNLFPEVVELGRTAFTHADLAHALEEATGKKLNIVQVDEATFNTHVAPYSRNNLEMMMQQYVANGNNGEAAVVDTDFVNAIGHDVQPLSEAIKSLGIK